MNKKQGWIVIVALTLIVIIILIGHYRQNAESEEDRQIALQINLQRLNDYIAKQGQGLRTEQPTLIKVD